MMVYTYGTVRTTDSERDEIVFGVMTDETDATLVKLISSIFKDFIEFKLVRSVHHPYISRSLYFSNLQDADRNYGNINQMIITHEDVFQNSNDFDTTHMAQNL